MLRSVHAGSDAETRDSVVRNWREQSLDLLVVTDAGSRDLVLDTSFVISYDIPTDAETYADRAQLVAENGTKFTLVAARERALLSEIENFLGMRVKAVLPPTRADAVAQRTDAFKQRLRMLLIIVILKFI